MSVQQIQGQSIRSGSHKSRSVKGGFFLSQELADKLFGLRTRPNINITSNGYSTTVTTLLYENGGVGGNAQLSTGTWDFSSSVYIPPLKQVLRIGGNSINQMQMYDASTNTWTAKAAQPLTDMNYGTAAWDEVTRKVYIIGNNTTTAYFYSYDPILNAWSGALSQTGMTNRLHNTMVCIDGKLYVYGGTAGSVVYSELWIYDTTAGTWSAGLAGTTANGGPDVRYGHVAVVMEAGPYVGQMAVVAGASSGGPVADTRPYFYNPRTNTWSNPAAYTFATNWAQSNYTSIQSYYPAGTVFGQYIILTAGHIPNSGVTSATFFIDTLTGYVYQSQQAFGGYGVRSGAVYCGMAMWGWSTNGVYMPLRGGLIINALSAMALPAYGS